ncbi:MAG: hypothetical protein ACM3IH_22750, partial [Sphingobacteriales bacterium]
YRWRFRKSPHSEVQSGVGRVVEEFAMVPLPNGNSVVSAKNGPGSLYISAGEIRLLWSVKDAKSAFAYYCRPLAQVRVISGAAFGATP